MSAAAFSVIDGLSEADLLLGVTPERIGDHLGYSASSVRYQFSVLFRSTDNTPGAPSGRDDQPARRWTFDRARLLGELLADIEQRVLDTTVEIRDAYLLAIDEAADTRDLAPLLRAVTGDLDAFSPGATDASTTFSERTYLLAVAAADTSAPIARRLRRIRDGELALYAPMYQRGLVVTGRRLLPGVELIDIAATIAQLVEGASIVRRYSPPSARGDQMTARAMLAIFMGMTERDPSAPAAAWREPRCGAQPS